MPHSCSIVVFQGDTSVDIEVQRRAVEVSFTSEHDERAYERSDRALRERIRRVFEANEVTAHVLDDWWPNRTASLEADESAITPATVDDLRRLLDGEYAGWSIGLEAYRDLDGDSPEDLGPIHIYFDAILTTKQLRHLVSNDA
jgi:hypothetical protein